LIDKTKIFQIFGELYELFYLVSHLALPSADLLLQFSQLLRGVILHSGGCVHRLK
jgi:hypothetical protein